MNLPLKTSRIFVAGLIAVSLLSGCGGPKESPETPPKTEEKPAKGSTTKQPETTKPAPASNKVSTAVSKPTEPGALAFDEEDTLDPNKEATFEAFDGDWVGHDNLGQIINLKLNSSDTAVTIQSQFYKGPPKGDTGPCTFDVETKEVRFGCRETETCTHRAYLTTDGKLRLIGEDEPSQENGWEGIDQQALLVSVDDPQAGEFTTFRTKPPLTKATLAEYEAFKAETAKGGENFTSTNGDEKLPGLDAPPNEDDFIWIIRPAEDKVLQLPSTIPTETTADPTQPPSPAYNEIPLTAVVVSGKQPPEGRVQLIYEASLAVLKTDAAKKQVSLNPGVNRQDFSFNYNYRPQEGSDKYTGEGTILIYLTSKGDETKLISNILTQKFTFE